MSTHRGSSGERTDGLERAGVPESFGPEEPPRLASTLVTYRDAPDQRTLYPPGLSCVARMSTWLTADDAAFVDLERMR